MPQGVALWCSLGGLIVPTGPSQEKEILAFVEKCASFGVTRLFPSALRPDSFPRFINFDQASYGGPVLTTADFYGGWNPLAAMAEAARKRGIEVHPYYALNAHGGGTGVAWSLDYVRPGVIAEEAKRILAQHKPISARLSAVTTVTRFANDHRQFWKKDRQGRDSFQAAGSVSLSPAFPEVRAYEADLLLKTLEGARADGVQIELVLEPTDEKGVIIYGYEAPALAAYNQKHGRSPLDLPNDDPVWVQFRCDYVTTFLRELRAKMKARSPKAALTMALITKDMPDYKKTFQDWPAWAEHGLIDGLYLWFRTTTDLEAVAHQTREAAQVLKGRIPLAVELSCYHPGSFQSAELLLEAARRARANGADSIGVYRSHAVEQLEFWSVVEQIAKL